ncbi:amino acid ABC transporter ATP-binding protein [Clostridium tepidiprofundi]|uniref:amino acid ABC transporter ATP-binding protein n=1 Tax=Clostridium tepidiprofundi TaxID=420412 RepID=UPI00191BD559|nr:amino acid ABC transporter ATP-binding protein [Clostridium tepidiprofundi]
MLKLRDIDKYYGDNQILKNVNTTVREGDVISIIGPSGSGKSTLLRCIIGLEKINRGLIEVNGKVIAGFDENGKKINIPKQVVKEGYMNMGMVFQDFNLFPHKTVLENVIEAPLIVKKMSKKGAVTLAKEQLDKVGLLDKINSYPSQLSGGQKQRVAIARALAMKPEIILFDEPTSALDPELVGEVLNVIKELALEKMTMLIVTHQMDFARKLSDRIIFMDKGSILEDAPPEEIFNNSSNTRIKEFVNSILV